MNPVKKEYLKEEILYLLDSDFIEPSKNDWLHLCIFFLKPDATYITV